MRETHAFAIVKELKAKGHSVVIEDQPKLNKFVREDDVAIVGDKTLTQEAVKECCDHIRKELCKRSAPYTIDTREGEENLFPGASFAAW